VIFLALLSFTVLKEKPEDDKKITTLQWIVFAIVLSLTTTEIRQVNTSKNISFEQKSRVYRNFGHSFNPDLLLRTD